MRRAKKIQHKGKSKAFWPFSFVTVVSFVFQWVSHE